MYRGDCDNLTGNLRFSDRGEEANNICITVQPTFPVVQPTFPVIPNAGEKTEMSDPVTVEKDVV